MDSNAKDYTVNIRGKLQHDKLNSQSLEYTTRDEEIASQTRKLQQTETNLQNSIHFGLKSS